MERCFEVSGKGACVVRYLLLLMLLTGCEINISSRPSEKWYIRFSDGTRIEIDHPKFVAQGYKCASSEYSASGSVSEKVKLVNKYFGAEGFEVVINERRTVVPICEEKK
jgi:hypothetical protein